MKKTAKKTVFFCILHYFVPYMIIQNAEKNSFFAVFFIFFALGFAYVKNLLYLCGRKGKSIAQNTYEKKHPSSNHRIAAAEHGKRKNKSSHYRR